MSYSGFTRKVKKLYPSLDEDGDLVYKGSSDETKRILENYNNHMALFKKQFIKRILSNENENKELSEKIPKLEENINLIANTLRSLQEEKLKNDEQLKKLVIEAGKN